jgi:hypothetical protein
MMPDMFDDLAPLGGEPERLFAVAGQRLAAAGELHRLFELRLLQERRRLGLALDRRTPIDEVEEPLRSQLEAAYLAACREVGELLLETGRLREAWMYLRPAGDKLALRKRLARTAPDDSRADELIELALYEAVDPERGYAWLLGRQGTCNAITTLDGLEPQLSIADVRACATVLVRHIYQELQGNLRGHLHRLDGSAPEGTSIRQLCEEHPELQARGDYHLDASHLASAMRYARLLTEPSLVAKALEIAEYGSRLPEDLQYPGDAPFENLYESHLLWLQATLGRDVDAAVDYFGVKATAAEGDQQTATAVEAYLVLLMRAGRAAEALEQYSQLVPAGRELSRYAPTLLEMAVQSGAWSRYAAICRERGDLLGYAAGLVAQSGDG